MGYKVIMKLIIASYCYHYICMLILGIFTQFIIVKIFVIISFHLNELNIKRSIEYGPDLLSLHAKYLISINVVMPFRGSFFEFSDNYNQVYVTAEL